jgi:hypothetical protein
LLDYIAVYENSVHPILSLYPDVKSDEAKKSEIDIHKHYELIQHFLEANQRLLNFSENELKSAAEFHSIISNSPLFSSILHGTPPAVPTEDLSKLKRDFSLSLKRIRIVCWRHFD